MKDPLWFSWAVVAIILFAAAFGYFDPELSAMRRLIGCGMIATGVVLAVPAIWRLADDWPRPKPQHDFNGAFAQIALAVVVLCTALMISYQPEAMIARFSEPLPNLSGLSDWVAGFSPRGP